MFSRALPTITLFLTTLCLLVQILVILHLKDSALIDFNKVWIQHPNFIEIHQTLLELNPGHVGSFLVIIVDPKIPPTSNFRQPNSKYPSSFSCCLVKSNSGWHMVFWAKCRKMRCSMGQKSKQYSLQSWQNVGHGGDFGKYFSSTCTATLQKPVDWTWSKNLGPLRRRGSKIVHKAMRRKTTVN